jgi:hypothetical protein
MAWEEGAQQKLIAPISDYNQVAKLLKGNLDDKKAKITLATFLRRNLGFTFELMSGMRLLPQQEIVLKSLFMRDNGLVVAGRGYGKSTLIAMFCTLFPIFCQRAKICLISANFRGARRIFDEAEKMVKGEKAHLLRECFSSEPSKKNDIMSWKLDNGSDIFALPLSSGDGLRGTRASVVFVDEGLLISEEIQKKIIRPFLTARQNYLEEVETKEAEDELIKAGLLTESDRVSFPKNKYLICSSASYDFDYLYSIYRDYINNIMQPPEITERGESPPTYFVVRSSYESLPDDSFIDHAAIESAKANGGEDSDYFKREYRAMFSNGGDSFFNPKNMKECTVLDGSEPTVLLRGKSNESYGLAIDPSYSESKSSDFFAIGVYAIHAENKSMTLVHSYGVAGRNLSEHYKYLLYLLTHFNIEWITIDASGSEFIDSFNQSSIAQEAGIKLSFLTAELHKEDPKDYQEQLRKFKSEYNVQARRYVYRQPFSSPTIRMMNERLQAGIGEKKVWWASRLNMDESAFQRAISHPPSYFPPDASGKDISISEFIDMQDDWQNETKKQLSLIEVSSTANGHMQFDLPNHIRKSKSTTKPRRDNYTCMLMAYMMIKHYTDMLNLKEVNSSGFVPFAI